MLTTSRLTLLLPHEIQAAQLLDYELRNRDFFTPWVPLRFDDWFTMSAQQRRIDIEAVDQQQGRSYRFFLCSKESPTHVIGDAGLSTIVRGAFHSCYLGYKIDGERQGQGYMREALTAIIDYAFQHLNLHRVEANIMPRNARSIRLIEGLGFEREGYSPRYLKINGVWEDHVGYALLNDKI